MLDDDVPSSGSSGSTPSKGTPSPWIFITLIAFLILSSVGWFAYTQAKGHPGDEEDADGIYRTVQSDGGEFESGLNADDGADNMLNSDAVKDDLDEDEGLN